MNVIRFGDTYFEIDVPFVVLWIINSIPLSRDFETCWLRMEQETIILPKSGKGLLLFSGCTALGFLRMQRSRKSLGWYLLFHFLGFPFLNQYCGLHVILLSFHIICSVSVVVVIIRQIKPASATFLPDTVLDFQALVWSQNRDYF